jgi:ATP-dependent Zn protease
LDELRVKAAKVPAKTKPQIDKAVKDLVTKRDAAAKEILEIDKATLETLRVAKAKVDQKLALLKQGVRGLHAKLP